MVFGGEGRGSRSFGGVNRRGPCGLGGEERGPCVSEGEDRETHGFGVLLFAMQLRQQERLCQDEKGRKDSCWWAMRRCHMALD